MRVLKAFLVNFKYLLKRQQEIVFLNIFEYFLFNFKIKGSIILYILVLWCRLF